MEWIKCSDRLPEKDCMVIVKLLIDRIVLSKYINNEFMFNDCDCCGGYRCGSFTEPIGNVIYWMPLPELPKNKD